jgi:hypothetical protein
MSPSRRPPKERPRKEDRRKDLAERLRRQHELEEEQRKRLQARIAVLGFFWG